MVILHSKNGYESYRKMTKKPVHILQSHTSCIHSRNVYEDQPGYSDVVMKICHICLPAYQVFMGDVKKVIVNKI